MVGVEMKITKRQLRRVIKEEKAKLAEISAAQAANINREQFALAGANNTHRLGAAIEEAIALAQQAHPNSEVHELLLEAHELLMGY
jgi:hypothetical protein